MNDAPLMISVSGLRGLIGQSLTPQVATHFAAAYGSHLKQTTGHPNPHVVFGRDSRPSGQMIESAAIAGLSAAGCRVTTLGIVTTPSVAIMIEHLGAQGGMVATASHNPIIWNGLKPLTADGVAPPPDQSKQIIERFHKQDFDYAPVEQLQPIGSDDTTHRVHVDRVLNNVDVQAIRDANIKAVLDSVHGAGGPAGAMLLNELGVELVHLYGETTGHFPHIPEPTAENLTGLSDAVRQHNAHIGLAQDPDADRLAVADENGAYIGEEYTLALCAKHVMARTPGPAAANLSTSRMIDDIATQHDQTVYRTPVGEANVAKRMRETNCVVGGEGNGGIIWPVIGYVRDSLAGAALLLELMATTGKTVSQLVDEIPTYTIVKTKCPIPPGMAEAAGAAVKQAFADHTIDEQDGVRVDLPDGWIHVRPSNTEPIMRIIVEAPDQNRANQLLESTQQAIG